jgi:hypothetical protein
MLMPIAEIVWKPHWILLVTGVAVLLLIWQGAQTRLKIERLEKKIDRLEAQNGKTGERA